MKKHIGKKAIQYCSMAFAMLLLLTACDKNTPDSTAAPSDDLAQTPTENAKSSTPERTLSDTILLNGKETTVFLDVSDQEIEFWDNASGGNLLAAAKYPDTIDGAAAALDHCDFTDLDGDGNSDPTAFFTFEDGSTASILWFFTDGGFVYNEEFSQLPGSTSSGEE